LVSLDRDTILEALRLMIASRGIDERCKQLLAAGLPVPNYHSGVGQEATSVGVGLAARPNDYLMFTYRDFGMLLAKGVPLLQLVGDLLLKRTGGTRTLQLLGCSSVAQLDGSFVVPVGPQEKIGPNLVELEVAASRR
jgi:TPP-dependent pyruvate/acetoin dehydrogenase alpha subunit